MAQKITFYAIIDEFSSRDRPGGVLRRVVDGDGRVDEAFSPDLTWEFSPLLYAAERGDTMFEFVPISEDEADRIVARIREAAGPAESPPARPLSPATPRAHQRKCSSHEKAAS